MRSQALATYLLGFSLCGVLGQAPSGPGAPGPLPVQAEFLKPLQFHKLAAGATVFARVTAEWKGAGCVLHPGAVLEAKVEPPDPHKNRGRSTLALSFDRAQCDGSDLLAFPLVLVAASAPPVDSEVIPDVQINSPRLRPHPVGELMGPGNEPTFEVQSYYLKFTGVSHHFPLKPDLRPGDVLGIRGLKLEVGAGPNRSSVFSSPHADLSLKAYTQILLNPPSIAFVPAAVSSSNPAVSSANSRSVNPPAPITRPPLSTLETCKPPACVSDPPLTAVELESRALGTISVAPLGYGQRSHRMLANFDRDMALAWLGSDQLLFAFNTHSLIPRGNESPETVRVVRAVVLSTSNHAVLQSIDWKIRDTNQFVWQLDANRVLVHVGDELRVYARGLELEHTIPLKSALGFLRISPSGELTIVGTLRERHSPELHAHLREQLGAEPEEDMEITMFDKDFHAVSSATTASGLTPPILLNEGQVTLRTQSEGAYRMAIDKWESTTATLARFNSLCAPLISSFSPDLLFLVSCVTNVGEPEYRVLHADGSLMLRGRQGFRQLGMEASGNPQRFAVKIVSRSDDGLPGAPFTASDLEFAEIRVYRAEDGRRLRAVRVSDPPTSYGGFALSPEGSQIAVLSGSEIKLYALPED